VGEMSDELLSFEEGDRVAVMRLAPLTGDIQIVEATVVGMIDEYQAVIKFAGGDNTGSTLVNLQVRGDKIEVIFPKDRATVEPVFPFPDRG